MKIQGKVHVSVFLLMIFLSVIFVIYPVFFSKSGVLVVSVSEDSACQESLTEGSVITSVNGRKVASVEGFYQEIEKRGESYNFIVDGNPRMCAVPADKELILEVASLKENPIIFGLSLNGGKKIILKPIGATPMGDVQIISDKISERAKIIGVSEFKIEAGDKIELSFTPSDESKIKKIIEPGIVNFGLIQKVKLKNGVSTIQLSESKYEFQVDNGTVVFQGSSFGEGDSLTVDGVDFKIDKIEANETDFLMNVLEDGDIITALTGSGNSNIFRQGGLYGFMFQVELTAEGSEKFEKVTKNQESTINSLGEPYLKEPMIVSIDGKEFLRMPVSGSDAGQKVSRLIVFGFEKDRKMAEDKMATLVAFLNTKRIGELQIIGEEQLTRDKSFLNMSSLGIFSFIVIASVVTFLRNKQPLNFVVSLGVLTLVTLVVVAASIFKVVLFVAVSSSVVFIILQKDSFKNKLGYLTVFTLFLVSFNLFIIKVIVDNKFLVGVLLATGINSILFLFNNINIKKDRLGNLDLYIVLGLGILLIVSFFAIDSFKTISMIGAFGILVGLGFSEQLYEYFKKG
ncbi:hypothetical protein A3K63_00575 [Candidatus Micrarchaeota archaeon RBG_16_49_10]|nr:MAG: hypothetical protein A3K63_00575 [Candidatus Micrarchaeota archaeon RBG_16_49_10]